MTTHDGDALVELLNWQERRSDMEPMLTFGEALRALKEGKRAHREGWNGKGMYIWLMPEAIVKAEWCREPHLKRLAEEAGGEIRCLSTVRMLTAQGEILTGWLASQSDMMACDWIVEDLV